MMRSSLWLPVWLAATGLLAFQPILSAQQSSAPAPVADAADDSYLAVVSLAGTTPISQAVIYLSEVAGQPAFGGLFAGMAGGFLAGIDPNQPWGVAVKLVDGSPDPLIFLPCRDVAGFLRRLEGQIGPAEKLQGDTDIYVVAAGPTLLYIKQAGDWAFASQNRDSLRQVPAKPLALLGDLPKEYLVAVQLSPQQIPAEQRESLLSTARDAFEAAMLQQAEQPDEEALQSAKATLDSLQESFDSAQTLLVALAVDAERERIVLDYEFTAVPGSELAEISANTIPLPSKFASVISSDAAAYVHSSTSVSPKVLEQMRDSAQQTLQTFRKQIFKDDALSDDQQEEVLALVRQVVDIVVETAEEGKIDFGAQVDLSQPSVQVHGGMFVADGAKVADLVKELAGKLELNPNDVSFSFDQDTYKEVTLHTVEIRVRDRKAADILGERFTVKLGTGANAVYFAAGSEADAKLKRLIDVAASDPIAAERPLSQFYVALMPFLRLAEQIDANPTVQAMVQGAGRSPGSDNAIFTTAPITDGQRTRIMIGEGIIRAIAEAVARQIGQPAPAGF